MEHQDGLRYALENYFEEGSTAPDGRGRRRRAAMPTNSGRDSASILRMTLPRCALTVISLIPSSSPTSLFGKPTTTNAMTSRSRAVRFE